MAERPPPRPSRGWLAAVAFAGHTPGLKLLFRCRFTPRLVQVNVAAALNEHGLDGQTPGGRGVLCTADGPYDEDAWLVLRVWRERDDEREALARQLGELRTPDKAALLLQSRLDHAYFVPGCPVGSQNRFFPGLLL